MPNINITVAEKIATNTTPGEVIVCGNSNYTVTFDLDAEWTAETARTARFVYYKNGLSLYQDVAFTGNTVAVPTLYGVAYVLVGVYAGNLRTTTPAKVLCDRSILCGDPLEVLTPEEKAKLQAQIGDLSQLQTSNKSSLVAAVNETLKTGGNGSNSSGNVIYYMGSEVQYPAGEGFHSYVVAMTSLSNRGSGIRIGDIIVASNGTLCKVTGVSGSSVNYEPIGTIRGTGNAEGGSSDSTQNVTLTAEQITALDNMFKVCAFVKADISAEYNAFKTAFGITDSGGEEEPDEPVVPDEPDSPVTPTVTLASISATYSGGSVPAGTAVNDLTGIVVTAHYSDGSTAPVSGYTLSGTIAEGSNTVTVTYQGKTATFTVTGVAESGSDPIDTTAEFNETDVVLSNANKTQPKTGYSATRPYDLGYSINGTTSEYVVYYLPGTDNLPSGQYNKLHVYLNGTYGTYYTVTGYNEEKKSLIEGRYGEANQLRFAFATDGVDDAYAYMETSGNVLFAGKNTPYYGMSNISQAQG